MRPNLFAAALTASIISFSTITSAADLANVPAGKYAVDPTHAYINFSYNHLGLSNPVLSFSDFSIDLDLDNEDPTNSSVAVTIDVSSIVTGSDIFNEHINGEKWLDSAAHPEITFNSTAIEAGRDGVYTVTGDLTVKGVTKPTKLAVTINGAMNHPMSGKPVIGIQATSDLLRSDFGVGAFAPNVGDELALNVTAELLKAE